MKNLLKTLVCATGLVGLLGCQTPADKEKEEYDIIRGTVISEEYIAPQLVSKDDSWFSNETLQLGDPRYSFQIENEKGTYTFSVDQGWSSYPSIEAVNFAVDVGDKVLVDLGGGLSGRYEELPPGSITRILSHKITVLEEAEDN